MSAIPSSKRVVITGMGVVCPLGTSLEALWTGLDGCRSGIVKLESTFGYRLAFPYGGVARDFQGAIEDFEPLEAVHKKQIRKGLKLMCREIQMGVAAAQFALNHAGLASGGFDPDRTGVSFGSDHIVAAPDEFVQAFRACRNGDHGILQAWGLKGLSEITPLWLLKYLPNMPASHIAIYNDLRGPNNSITQREVSGLLAIAEATAIIRRGAADRMLVGATGSSMNPLRAVQASFLGEIARDAKGPEGASCPFDLHRKGMVPGEGSAALVLESLEAASARGATIHGEIRGSGSSCVVHKNGSGDIQAALRNAVRRTLVDPSARSDIGHLHAHGLATHGGDIREAQALLELWGESLPRLPVVAAKANFGNLGAASGLVELIGSLLAMRHGTLFASPTFKTPDPHCPLNVVREPVGAGRQVLTINATPSGQAASLLVGVE